MADLEQVFETKKNKNENVSVKNSSLKALKIWLKNDPNLPDTWDDCRLLSYLRCCDFSLEKTKKKLWKYFTLKLASPEFFTNQDITSPDFQKLLKKANLVVLPTLTSDGHRITISHYFDTNLDSSDFINLMRLGFMLVDTYLELNEEGIPGHIVILDSTVFQVGNLFKVSLPTFRKLLQFIQEALPFKISQVHLINASASLDFVMKLILPFCQEKVRKRFHIHKNLDTLYQFVSRDILPEELGGSAVKMENYMDLWKQLLEERREWFREQEVNRKFKS